MSLSKRLIFWVKFHRHLWSFTFGMENITDISVDNLTFEDKTYWDKHSWTYQTSLAQEFHISQHCLASFVWYLFFFFTILTKLYYPWSVFCAISVLPLHYPYRIILYILEVFDWLSLFLLTLLYNYIYAWSVWLTVPSLH